MENQRIAVIGSGISGMGAAWYLSRQGHDITLYESAERLGGHTATIVVQEEERELAVDTGFIVYNDWTYPEFIALMNTLGVESQPTRMSFSVSDAASGIEYAGSGLNALFAQRRNLLSPDFLAMVGGILRFNRQAEKHLLTDPSLASCSLDEYLAAYRYPESFRRLYLIPMGAAIWSSTESTMCNMPLTFFVRFFRNHGLLNIFNRPQWRVIKGGSAAYIPSLTAPFREGIRLSTPVREVKKPRVPGQGVMVMTDHGQERYDQVVFACHSDQALRILGEQASSDEKQILGAIPYEKNSVVLHTDTSLLPALPRCWSSWNVSLGRDPGERPALTYNMNILQGLETDKTYCVSLNQQQRIHDEHIIGCYEYDHPIFGQASTAAQARWHEINGQEGLWYCGAYWRNGFHEDGLWSALRVATAIQATSADTFPLSA